MGAVHVGGPVQPSAVVVLADFVDRRTRPSRSWSSPSDSCRRRSIRPPLGELRRARVYVGYAGWGPGQLDDELDEGSWIVEPALPEDVFTDDPDGLWSGVLRRKGGPFGLLAAMPPDPSRNWRRRVRGSLGTLDRPRDNHLDAAAGRDPPRGGERPPAASRAAARQARRSRSLRRG